MVKMTAQIRELIQRGAMFVINHSAGKDSQAMCALLREIIPLDQLLIVHAELPEVDWPGLIEHIESTRGSIPAIYTRAKKTFFDMVDHRGEWPSPQIRNCTSDLKRGPIEKAIRHELKRRGLLLVVNCVGLRAEESSSRAKAEVFKFSQRNSKAGREWHEWLPIHHLSTAEVFAVIEEAGESPHWAYQAGMDRLSCRFCIMASKSDLQVSAHLNPQLYARYVAKEREIDRTMVMPVKGRRVFLEEHTGISVADLDMGATGTDGMALF